ncbi:hypothetical protein [Rhodococcus sp. B10]|uniref:hypothetical protein n=1 Tax=Rhodococcus sp. B10 TaxID=2695876 RepID=UPI00142F8D5F|nr:hypothetical protein [Rhodococcus sp. B10]NIL77139.1 hypothetical protein [Rhodococcus sp. B10]
MAGRRKPAEIPEHIAKPEWSTLLEAVLNVEGSMDDTYRRMYNYSTRNLAYLAMQQCPIEPVATFKGWSAVNRQVQKGSSAFYILRPISIKLDEVDEKTGENKRVQRFKPVKAIFPISMTEGEPLPEIEHPEWSKERALAALAIREVAFESFDGNVQGHSWGRNFAVNPIAKRPQKTMVHELSHIVLGHTVPEAHEDYVRHRGIKEFQAEATAHLVTNELGLLTPEIASVSRAYVQNWLQGQTPSNDDIKGVFRATDEILAAGREPVEQEIAS